MTKKTHKYNPDYKRYASSDILEVLSGIDDSYIKHNNKGVGVYNVPCAFDIETSSFYNADGQTVGYDYVKDKARKYEKCSVMYVWQWGINGKVIIGRTWDEFLGLCSIVRDVLHLNADTRLICYVHNLSYEFQFIRTLFDWDGVFSSSERKPIYARTKEGIEFRCSYLLSGYSLAKVGEHLTKYKCFKQEGDLDYTLLRHTQTPLTEKEIGYCLHDVLVVMAYIQECIEQSGNILRIPLTNTGYVRKYCRSNCLRTVCEDGKKRPNYEYMHLMEHLRINTVDEFNMLHRAFAGGFTHANANYTGEVVKDVTSYDFTSSYPYVMVAEQYPMSSGVYVPCKTVEQFEYLRQKYCCVFDIEFTDIYATATQDNPISASKCYVKDNISVNNGRVVCARKIALTITNVDYDIIRNFYTWGGCRIGYMICYKRGYMPTPLVRSVLELYSKKTQLKGVECQEVEYMASKGMLNSCYGMCVTNPLRDDVVYAGEWCTNKLSSAQKWELLDKYNNARNRFLFYPWGVFVTAYARRNLFTGIYVCGDDYVYSDTDSIKIINADKYAKYFSVYNNTVENKLRAACKYHGIPFEMCAPSTIKGVTKVLGVWDYDGHYNRFKTLGAKRYMCESDGNLNLTVSGVNKKEAVPYLLQRYGLDGAFDAFKDTMDIPPNRSGKNLHTYIDYNQRGVMTDYLGNVCEWDTPTGVHLEPTGYTMSLSVLYLNYIMGLKMTK